MVLFVLLNKQTKKEQTFGNAFHLILHTFDHFIAFKVVKALRRELKSYGENNNTVSIGLPI